MSEKQAVHLPTEIVVNLANSLYRARCDFWYKDEDSRQHDMQKFCLVSRQWYSAGIRLLYRQPQLFGGNRFANFVRTICPPSREKKPTLELGSMVESLWLNKLVHHSSNSITARLLLRTHKSLVEFVAPRVSFSLNGLTALSKCNKLRLLNLSLVDSKSVTFPRLKKAISSLGSLEGLHLPTRIALTNTEPSDGQWPRSLTSIKLGGRIDTGVMSSFDWPSSLEELTLSGCKNLDVEAVEKILLSPQLTATLKRVVISPDNVPLEEFTLTQVLYSLPKLTSLECPVNLLETLGVLRDTGILGYSKLPLRELTVLPPSEESTIDGPPFFVECLLAALCTNLSGLLLLKLPVIDLIDRIPHEMIGKLDDMLGNHLEEIDDADLDNLDVDLEDVGTILYEL